MKGVIRLLAIFVFLLLHSLLYAQNSDNNATIATNENNLSTQLTHSEAAKNIEVKNLLQQKELVDKELVENNIWSKIYSNYHTYKSLKQKKKSLDKKIEILERKRNRTKNDEKILAQSRVVI